MRSRLTFVQGRGELLPELPLEDPDLRIEGREMATVLLIVTYRWYLDDSVELTKWQVTSLDEYQWIIILSAMGTARTVVNG